MFRVEWSEKPHVSNFFHLRYQKIFVPWYRLDFVDILVPSSETQG